MNDLLIKVSKRSRLIDLDHSTLGNVGENLQEKLVFVFQDEFVDGMARLEYELDGEKHYVLMEKVGQSYILPVQNVLLTKEGNIDLQLVVTQDETGTPVFKSEVFTLYCKKSIEAVGEAPSSYELWIEKANRILLEASRVNIDGKKTGNETIITITQRDGNKKSFPIQDGEQGPQGPQGPVGPQGPQGPEGPVGPTPDLSDYVKNTDYATSSKGGVFKTSSGALLRENGTIYAEERTYANYSSAGNTLFIGKGTLENVITGKQLVNQSTLETSQAEQDDTIEGLQAELDRYKLLENALPHTENETASDYVTLENTAKAPMEVSLTPQTSQETTTGKNLVNIGTTTFEVSKTYDGLSIPAGTYTFSALITSNDTDASVSRAYFYHDNDSLGNAQLSRDVRSNATITVSDSITKIILYASNTYNNSVGDTATYENVQLESGSTATSYEPYTGGIPAPNPDFPMDIHCTTGENQVKVVGKNLFDKDNANIINGYFLSGGVITASGDNRILYISCKPNTTYTLQKIAAPSNTRQIGYTNVLPAIGVNALGVVTLSAGATTGTITTGEDAKYLIVRYYQTAQYSGHTEQAILDSIQIETGSSATLYLPYEETTYTISLGTKEMFNISNVSDGFVYDENEDKFYINRMNGKVVLDGSENWAYNAGYTFFHVPNSSTPNISSNEVFTNYYKYFPNISGITGAYGCSVYQNAFRVKNTDYTNVTDFKSWLSTHNTIVVYQLETSTLEEITDATLISQLRAIKNALSMQGTTHIISTSSGTNLPFLIKARAVQTIERT